MDLAERWRQRSRSAILHRSPGFDDRGLVLGRGTVLLSFTRGIPAGFLDPVAHDRLLALLAVAACGRLARGTCEAILPSLGLWAKGDRALAAIRLALAPLPRAETDEAAHPLFLAEVGLDAGLSPRELCADLGYDAVVPLLKDYRAQPRVPPGSGRASGQWTDGAGGFEIAYDMASTGSVAQAPAVPKPAAPPPLMERPDPPAEAPSLLTPVFLAPRPEERTSEDIEPLPYPLQPESPTEAIQHGHPLDLISPFGKPIPFMVPLPEPGPRPGPRSDEVEDGPNCPAMENDIPRGPKLKADNWEAFVASLVNPSSPTPKRTLATPNVVSQAYYLLQPLMPSKRVSYDDCKCTREWSPIEGIRKGDMVDARSDDRRFV